MQTLRAVFVRGIMSHCVSNTRLGLCTTMAPRLMMLVHSGGGGWREAGGPVGGIRLTGCFKQDEMGSSHGRMGAESDTTTQVC